MKEINSMKEYKEEELREMISNLRLFKDSDKVSSLTDNTEIELAKYEMLLEDHLNNKYKDIDQWLSKNNII